VGPWYIELAAVLQFNSKAVAAVPDLPEGVLHAAALLSSLAESGTVLQPYLTLTGLIICCCLLHCSADSFKIDGYVLKTGDPVISTQTGSTSYTLTQLQPGVEYAFTIAAVNSKGNSTPATAMASTTKSRR
jgi:hypothetical protein